MKTQTYQVKDATGRIVGRLMLSPAGGYLTLLDRVGICTVERKREGERWQDARKDKM